MQCFSQSGVEELDCPAQCHDLTADCEPELTTQHHCWTALVLLGRILQEAFTKERML